MSSSPFAGWRREGEAFLLEPETVNETILVDEQTKRVSIPSALFVDAGVGRGLFAMRAGSVKERRALDEEAGGACSGVAEADGDDMVDGSRRHCCPRVAEMRVAWTSRDGIAAAQCRDVGVWFKSARVEARL